ncbi:hypothetical protein [Cohnella fermenti]|uniref:Uncharacterized protein n=1 Tax=Cohnella fermenti TaxID=2565925 RepID=A0A4S4C898_9BACL|nr:hypothetical protein [Cohnella fermenti]THF84243.1 hypothetical protein E6C55_02825 [Cohnella fermenti]
MTTPLPPLDGAPRGKLPDFVMAPTDPVLTNPLIDSGQFMPIDELFDKYANQIWKDHAAAHPEWNLLRQSGLETFNKIIYNKLPIDAFDTFVSNWKTNGGDQITLDVNDWFKSVSQ